MTPPLFIRRYRPEDRAACLALFDSNIPAFFNQEERVMFAEFLDRLPGPYLVVEGPPGQIVACGGVVSRDGVEAVLCWALVDVRRHKQGIGTVLVRALLVLTCRMPGISRAGTKTAPGYMPFLAREGLRFVNTIDNYFRPSVQLACELDAPRRAEIEARLAATLAQGHRLEDGALTVG